jgi:hypothetical protein
MSHNTAILGTVLVLFATAATVAGLLGVFFGNA